ncbi:MAG: Gfo/Idh/MocA family oxidoreductase [Myxococcales bacterium]|nr:Gfo/Idh/MocA family oxidoreductase [Myxococcales bacterium]
MSTIVTNNQSNNDGNWAIIGLGRIAASHVDALAQRPNRPLVAVVETDLARAAKGAELGAQVFGTIGAMLAEVPISRAIVCTPPHLHPAQVTELLQHGVATLVEKPLALSQTLAQRLVDLAHSTGCVLQTAAKFAATESIRTAGKLIAAGKIGNVVKIENVFSGPLDVRGDWRSIPEQAGGGVLFDNGPHVVDVVRTLVGLPSSIRVLHVGYKQGTGVEDEVEFELRTAPGIVTHSVLSWNEAKPAPIARVVGTLGELVVGWQRLECVVGDTTEVVGGGYDKRAAFVNIHDDFENAIAEKQKPQNYGVLGIALMEAGIRSFTSKQWESPL